MVTVYIGESHACNVEAIDASKWTRICPGKSFIMPRRDAGNAAEHTAANCIGRTQRRREL